MDSTELLPVRPMLRPGVRITRVGDGLLRFGLGDNALVLPDTADLRGLIPALREGTIAVRWTPAARLLGARLRESGLLIDGSQFWGRVGVPGEEPLKDAALASAFARGERPLDRLTRRADLAVRLDVPAEWHGPLTALMRAAGLRDPATVTGPADVAVLARVGELDREVGDAATRVGEPHLIAVAVEGVVTVGPFVVPGRTACLRCVDAHLADHDPRRPLVVAQYADPAAARRAPEPLDPTLLAIALGVIAHDLGAWAEGEEPATWSATLTVSAGLGLAHRRWARHVHCGCSWDHLLVAR